MSSARSGSIAIFDAHVLTMDPDQPTARAIVIHDGIIEHVGSTEEAKTRDRGVDRRLDANGKTVIPGFNDAHGHFVHEGMMAVLCDLHGCTSLQEAYGRIKRYANHHPDREVIVAERWDESAWEERTFPDRAGLDAAAGGRAVLARRIDGHVAVASSALLDIYDERWDGPTAGIDRDTGLLLEEPSLQFGNVVPYPKADKEAGLRAVFRTCLAHGATSVQSYERPDAWQAWQTVVRELDRQHETPGVRAAVSFYSESLDAHAQTGTITGTGSTWLRTGGMKIFADGSLGGHTAYLKEPYADRPDTHGQPNFTDEELRALVAKAHASDIQVHMHVIGDAAVEQGIDAYRNTWEKCEDPETFQAMRHRFEHYEMGTPTTHTAAKQMGIVLSMQPNFIGAWSTKEGLYGDRLGGRHPDSNQVHDLLKLGAHVAFGSDCMPFGPLVGIRGTLSAPYPHQRVPFDEAVRLYTTGAAFAEHQEHVKGMLRPGMYGDAVLFSSELHGADKTPADIVDGLSVAATIIDGRVRFDRLAADGHLYEALA